MDKFIRFTGVYQDFKPNKVDTTLSDWAADGWSEEPKFALGYSYVQMKAILIQILGRRVLETLMRSEGKLVDQPSFTLAWTIVYHYIHRPDPTYDLQTSLIVNLIASKSNTQALNKAKAFSVADRYVEQCGFDAAYSQSIKECLFEGGALSSLWWSMIHY